MIRARLLVLVVLGAGLIPGTAYGRSTPTVHRVPRAPTRASGTLGPLLTIPQTLNNCGPASVAEVLAYWHIQRTQYQVAAVLRADGAPWGMAPYGIPSYARSLGLQALVGADGTEGLIKALISNGFPVIVSQWVSASYRVRHYRPIEAYDDRRHLFISSDPYLGAGHVIDYGEFERIWTVSDGRFVVIYPPARAKLLGAVLAAAGWSTARAYRHDLAWEQTHLHNRQDLPGTALRYYGYPSLAWDEMELGQYAASRQALRRAARAGASSILIRWIEDEMRYLQSRQSCLRKGMGAGVCLEQVAAA